MFVSYNSHVVSLCVSGFSDAGVAKISLKDCLVLLLKDPYLHHFLKVHFLEISMPQLAFCTETWMCYSILVGCRNGAQNFCPVQVDCDSGF